MEIKKINESKYELVNIFEFETYLNKTIDEITKNKKDLYSDVMITNLKEYIGASRLAVELTEQYDVNWNSYPYVQIIASIGGENVLFSVGKLKDKLVYGILVE